MKLIYLASPYSHRVAKRKEERWVAVCRVAVKLVKRGLMVFSPIAHTHPLALVGNLPGDWKYWETYDRRMIAACDELWVVMLKGWEKSTGVKAEIKIAFEMGKPIVYLDENGAEVSHA